jgi:hypothetical protein
MASEEHVEKSGAEDEQSTGGSNGHNLGRVAAIAAASAGTAYAAKKAFSSSRSSSGESGDEDRSAQKSRSSASSSAALLTTAVTAGWDVAKDSVLPIVEDAATKAGAFVAERSPELVRDVVVPRFIAGFERAQRGKRGDDKSED